MSSAISTRGFLGQAAALWAGSVIVCLSPGAAGETAGQSLAELARQEAPWLEPSANSEQRQPVYLGATPREMALGLAPVDGGKVVLYERLRELGSAQAKAVRVALAEMGRIQPGEELTLEAWPTVNQSAGALAWVFARWRAGKGTFQWLDAGEMADRSFPGTDPVFPVFFDLRKKEDFSSVFDDVLAMKSLYDKPAFGECLWATWKERGGFPSEGWLPVEERARHREAVSARLASATPACRMVSQPPRLNGRPRTFSLRVSANGEVAWPADVKWKPEFETPPDIPPAEPRTVAWPENFTDAYRDDVLALDGEREALFPISGRKAAFVRKNNIQPDNQLGELVEYLEERYRKLGLKTRRQEFEWRGQRHANLIAEIPGRDPEARPVLMADHIDTAFCEDIYEATGERVSAPGADDNLSATAALLRAAEVLKDSHPRRPIWLVHLTGEEFPADDLGARHLVGGLLREKKDIEGLVLMDMIGYREKDDPIFQVNPGDSAESMRLAKVAMDAAKRITPLRAVLRPRFDERSYLYNTDGLIFSENGFPVVYLNEHMNRLGNFWRKGYHHSTDNSKKMDWDYAGDIAKVAIETAAVLAEAPPARR